MERSGATTEPAQSGGQNRGRGRDSKHGGSPAGVGGTGGSAARMAVESEATDIKVGDGEGERGGLEEGTCSDQELDDLLDCELRISTPGATPI